MDFPKAISIVKVIALIAPAGAWLLSSGSPADKFVGAVEDYTSYNINSRTRDSSKSIGGIIPPAWTPYLVVEIADRTIAFVKTLLD